jgi:hypothetical protein
MRAFKNSFCDYRVRLYSQREVLERPSLTMTVFVEEVIRCRVSKSIRGPRAASLCKKTETERRFADSQEVLHLLMRHQNTPGKTTALVRRDGEWRQLRKRRAALIRKCTWRRRAQLECNGVGQGERDGVCRGIGGGRRKGREKDTKMVPSPSMQGRTTLSL